MDGSRDFIQWLGQDMALKILLCLEDPSDFVRTSAVSRSWRHFVIANGLCKKLCLRKFPEASSFARVIESKNTVETVASGTDDSVERAYLEREHRVYASLSRDLTISKIENCISDAICASSTDNYPEESITNTLDPSDRVGHRASYWSSKGERNPSAPETLIYKLASQLCLITELHVHPFQAKAVRFQIGHPKVPLDLESDERDELLEVQHFSDDEFVWTYSSPEFPMVQVTFLDMLKFFVGNFQENDIFNLVTWIDMLWLLVLDEKALPFILLVLGWKKFPSLDLLSGESLANVKLPEPVLCIGGILKVELLGRVQTQEMDGQYYICITNVQAIGRTLSPAFDVEMIDEWGKCTLKYDPERMCDASPAEMLEAESSSRSHIHRFSESIRTWEQIILNTFRGAGPVMIDDYDSDYEYVD
ncbi:hypothetical protein DH2020_010014 [Rehmannia glutinosa]|uniref:F-box protein n=1 Tax=Rehmannia glutinosa TaxID=99300 RepID=A0ABR0X7Z4_REHGL